MGMRKALTKIPVLQASYLTGRPLTLPVNITISVSYRCNSKCRTCDVWRKPNDDLTLAEWDKVFASLGTSPFTKGRSEHYPTPESLRTYRTGDS